MLQSKHREYLNGQESMTHTYAVYRRPMSEQKNYTDWKWGAGKKFSKQIDRKKKAGVAILISDKIDFTRRAIKRHPEGHFIILKGRIHQEDVNIENIYAPNIGAPKYIKKILENFKKDIDSNTIIVGDFNTPLSKMDRSSKQNIKKDIVSLNNNLEEMDLTDIYRESFSSQRSKIHILFSVHGTFSNTDHIIGHKASLNKFKKIEIISSIFSDQKGWNYKPIPKEKTPNTQNHGDWIACY